MTQKERKVGRLRDGTNEVIGTLIEMPRHLDPGLMEWRLRRLTPNHPKSFSLFRPSVQSKSGDSSATAERHASWFEAGRHAKPGLRLWAHTSESVCWLRKRIGHCLARERLGQQACSSIDILRQTIRIFGVSGYEHDAQLGLNRHEVIDGGVAQAVYQHEIRHEHIGMQPLLVKLNGLRKRRCTLNEVSKRREHSSRAGENQGIVFNQQHGQSTLRLHRDARSGFPTANR